MNFNFKVGDKVIVSNYDPTHFNGRTGVVAMVDHGYEHAPYVIRFDKPLSERERLNGNSYSNCETHIPFVIKDEDKPYFGNWLFRENSLNKVEDFIETTAEVIDHYELLAQIFIGNICNSVKKQLNDDSSPAGLRAGSSPGASGQR